MKLASSPTLCTFAVCALLAIAAAAASAAVHWTFGYADTFTTTPHLFVILIAHYLFVVEVRNAKARKTAAGGWTGLGFFAVYVGVVIAAYGANFAQIGLADSARRARRTSWRPAYTSPSLLGRRSATAMSRRPSRWPASSPRWRR